MDVGKIEAEVLKIGPEVRARLAGRYLTSLEELSEVEVSTLWAEEAERRDAELDADPESELPVEDVFREARSKFL